MYCFGVSNHSTDSLVQFLVKHSRIPDPSEVSILSVGTVLPERIDSPVLMFTNISDFVRNYKLLNERAPDDLMVFLFASPLRIREWPALTPLDFVVNNEYRNMAYRFTPLDIRPLRRPGLTRVDRIKRDSGKFLTKLIDSVKNGSLLNPLMTFIYMLPKASHQNPVKESVANGFFHNWTPDQVFADIENQKLLLSKKATALLTDILNSDAAEAYRKAFRAYHKERKTGNPNLGSICKQLSVSDYELRYLLHVVEGYHKLNPCRGKPISYQGKKET